MMPLAKHILVLAGICLCLSLAIAGCGKNAGPSALVQGSGKKDAPARESKIAVWIKQLKDKDPDRRLAAAKALGEQGPEAKSAAPELAAAAKACTWEIFVLEEELASGAGKTFTQVGTFLGTVSEADKERIRKQAEKDQAEAKKTMEKIKPLIERLHKEEKTLTAILDALERTDPTQLNEMGLDKERLEKVKTALGKRRKAFTLPFQTIPNPPTQPK